MTSALREPLLQFFLIGAAVFGLFVLLDDTPPPVADDLIVVTADDIRRLAVEFEATWRRPPEPADLDRMIDAFVREEVYVREATLLGLDRGDAVIRQRLQMKMEFLTEAGAQAVAPDDATLAAHLAAHAERFARPPMIAFEQVMLDEDVGSAAITEIRAALNTGRDPAEVGRHSLLPSTVTAAPRQVVDGTFGTGFFDAVSDLPPGEWAGPVTTAFGRHLVHVTERRERGMPPLEAIRERVLQDWRATLAADLKEKRFEVMRARYTIKRPDVAEALGR